VNDNTSYCGPSQAYRTRFRSSLIEGLIFSALEESTSPKPLRGHGASSSWISLRSSPLVFPSSQRLRVPLAATSNS
jgi:hypothetical protein